MGSYVLTRRIAAPIARVFEGFTDPALMVDWMDAASITRATGPMDRAGTRYRFNIRGRWGFDVEILESAPPTAIGYAGQGPLGASFRARATLRDEGNATYLEHRMDYTVPFGLIGRWYDRRFLQPSPRSIANRELDRLVMIMESRGG